MALPTSGIMTAAMINQELKRASNAPFSLDDPAVRKLAGKLTGTISYADFYGKSSEVVVVATAGMKGIVAKSLFTPEVWASDTDKRIVIPAGVEIGPEWGYVFATSPNSDGQAGSFVGKLVLDIQNGAFLSGHGGAANSGEGGNCIYANLPGRDGQKLIIRNAGTIRAGGGGGGRGGAGGGGKYAFLISTVGGAGGDGGVGQGYGQVSSNGADGAPGDPNAGAGGTGGAGGGWGSPGNTGASGIAGNRTGGSAGNVGGLAGMAITDPANYTLENTGVVLGRT